MNRFMLVLTLILAPVAFASEKKPSLQLAPKPAVTTQPGGGGAADILNSKNAPPAPPKSGVKVSLGCTDPQGKRLSAGDAGYNECIADAQKQHTKSPTGQAPGAGNSMNLQFGQ